MRVASEEIYRVHMFKERGYKRQRCRICGAYFWSVVSRDNCGDAPCTDYTFFNIKLGVGPLTVKEVRERFLRFFERRGHKVIEPRPVLARWRDDLYLTIASIVVFQPHVTSGMVPPPANPLVIAQPCIRLEDIDSVGYTFGRHLTNFIMGGHHAFNYPDKYVYFTNETVEYAREFFVEELGIPEDEVTFKESWWEGGGNAGPSFEVAVGGLELATLVFMMYEVVNGKYVPMPLKIVDTGYGIERIAWLTQKSPTAFHAIYGDLVSSYFKELGLEEPPKDFFFAVIRYAGKLNPKDSASYNRLKELVTRTTGISKDLVNNYLGNSIAIFTLLDHIKTALLMLSDGAVPSNSGEGYLVRLVLRRIFRTLYRLERLEALNNLVNIQISFWSDLYPNIKLRSDYIYEVIDNELKKYLVILRRAPQIVNKYLRKGELNTNTLIQLYDSQGIPPEVVKDIAKSKGLEVDIPSNFYSVLASKHSKAPIKGRKKVKLPENVVNEASRLKPTKMLFHEDPYMREFTGKVIKVIDNEYVILDKTAFYPEGGGQEPDRGYFILPNGFKVKVVDVQKVGNVVIHRIGDKAPAVLREGLTIKGVIDWKRRYALMRHHTATHIILGAARKVLGEHVWQAGAEKTEERGRLDITHYKPLSPKEVRAIEDIANEVIIEGREVRTYFLPRYEAERRYGFRLYQGGVPMEPVIRVVEIEDHDAEACFGTHLRNTREVGGIKIVNVEKIADGIIRLEYVAGTQLVNYARKLEEILNEASRVLGGDVSERVRVVVEELSRLKSVISSYRDELVRSLESNLVNRALKINNLRISVGYTRIPDKELVRNLLLKLSRKYEDLMVVFLMPRDKSSTIIEVSLGSRVSEEFSAPDILKAIILVMGGRGGGKRDHAVGLIPVSVSDELTSKIISIIREVVSRNNTV